MCSLESIFQKHFYFLGGTQPFLVLVKQDSWIIIQMPQSKRRESSNYQLERYIKHNYTFTGRMLCIVKSVLNYDSITYSLYYKALWELCRECNHCSIKQTNTNRNSDGSESLSWARGNATQDRSQVQTPPLMLMWRSSYIRDKGTRRNPAEK